MVRAVKLLLACVLAIAIAIPAGARADTMPDDVRITVSRYAAQMRRCYDHALRDQPGLGGKLVVRFRVGASGRARTVQFVSGESTLHHAGVERCVARVFRAMRFRHVTPTWYRSPLIFGAG
jgi:hypothetical protein